MVHDKFSFVDFDMFQKHSKNILFSSINHRHRIAFAFYNILSPVIQIIGKCINCFKADFTSHVSLNSIRIRLTTSPKDTVIIFINIAIHSTLAYCSPFNSVIFSFQQSIFLPLQSYFFFLDA